MLTEQTSVIPTLKEDGLVEVLEKTTIYRDGVALPSPQNHRRTIAPGSDYSNEPRLIRALCQACHVPTVVDSYKKRHAHQEALMALEMEPDKQELKDAEKAAKQALKDAEKAHKDFIEAQG